jgi:hypothetical protein
MGLLLIPWLFAIVDAIVKSTSSGNGEVKSRTCLLVRVEPLTANSPLWFACRKELDKQ